jgi:Zn-finger nucleic acid-binding protein
MRCPVCSDTDLLMTDRQGVEIDYCPVCRGVWLDRGELDKIIERSNEMSTAPAGPQAAKRDDSRDDHRDTHHADHGYDDRDGRPKKKKGGLLGDLLGGLGGD